MRLLSGIIDTLKEMAGRGVDIKKFHAVSDTPDGIKLSRALGFEENPPTGGSTFRRYTLNTETSEVPFVKEYREALQKYKNSVAHEKNRG